MKINQENWTFTQFTNGNLKAFISLGADLAPNGEASAHYLATLTDQDYQEVFQTLHATLDEALATLNAKYGEWDIADGLKPSGDGCSSCAAH